MSKLNGEYWDLIYDKTDRPILEDNIAIYYRSEHIRLIKKWGGARSSGSRILKTDLYEEAFGNDHFLFWLLRHNTHTYGMDISHKIGNKARSRAAGFKTLFDNCITSDVRACAIKDESFDLVISNSTLDNLASSDIPRAMGELRRILKPKGTLILTLDNGNNPLYVFGYILEKILKFNKYYQGRCFTMAEAKRLIHESNFVIQDMDAIVHIPTPFNKIALLLSGIKNRMLRNKIRFFISLFSKLGGKKTKFSTGWFIAFKLVKNDK